MGAVNASSNFAHCNVIKENGFWILRSDLQGSGGADATCSARCLNLGT